MKDETLKLRRKVGKIFMTLEGENCLKTQKPYVTQENTDKFNYLKIKISR